jgi:hypothetical protein
MFDPAAWRTGQGHSIFKERGADPTMQQLPPNNSHTNHRQAAAAILTSRQRHIRAACTIQSSPNPFRRAIAPWTPWWGRTYSLGEDDYYREKQYIKEGPANTHFSWT